MMDFIPTVMDVYTFKLKFKNNGFKLGRYGWHGPTASLRAYGGITEHSADPSDNDGLWTGMVSTQAPAILFVSDLNMYDSMRL